VSTFVCHSFFEHYALEEAGYGCMRIVEEKKGLADSAYLRRRRNEATFT